MYVWVDALTNYITARLPRRERAALALLAGDMHIIGKDIVPLPRGLLAGLPDVGGIELPKRVFAHGFLYNRGEKMSKSVGNVVDPFDLVRALRRRSGALLLPARGGVRPGRHLQP